MLLGEAPLRHVLNELGLLFHIDFIERSLRGLELWGAETRVIFDEIFSFVLAWAWQVELRFRSFLVCYVSVPNL